MMRYEKKLAQKIVHHSCKVNAGDKVYVNVVGYFCDLVDEIVAEIYKCKAIPLVHLLPNDMIRTLLCAADTNLITAALNLWSESDLSAIQSCDSYIEIMNDGMLTDLKLPNLVLYKKHYYIPTQWQPRFGSMKKNEATRWVTVRNPNDLIFSHAGINVDRSLNWVWKCYIFNYENLRGGLAQFIHTMNNTNMVHIYGNETDLHFSIKGQKVILSDGQVNIPDGEIYVAPIKDSINGKIMFNVPIWYMGEHFESILLTIKKGRVIDYVTDNPKGMGMLLSIDEGAKYFGEFAIGVNPSIDQFIGNILFDEKMLGTIHMALGHCAQCTQNGNQSSIHMDMISDLRNSGTIMFDDNIVYSNGEFTSKEMKDFYAKY